MNIKKGRKIICCLLIVFVAVVAVVFATRQNSVEIQAPDATKDSTVVDTAYAAENKANKANDNTSEEVSDEATEEETQEATAARAEEASVETTKKKATATKKETATKKTETTTKAETTTKSSTTPTSSTKVFYYNGVAYKPYEVFVHDSGNEVYYDEYGRLTLNISVSGKTEDRDSSRCYECGSKECIRAMSDYHCSTCGKDVPALTCHPRSHYNASH